LRNYLADKPVNKFTAFHGTQIFITTLRWARPELISWATSIHCNPPPPTHTISLRLHVNIMFRSAPSLPCDLFCSGLPTKTLYTSLISPLCDRLHARPISSCFIWSIQGLLKGYAVKSTNPPWYQPFKVNDNKLII
jgi:hypothetical protein